MNGRPCNDGKWCLGHGVPGQAESLRTGHFVEAELVDANFSTHSHGRKTLATEYLPRCNHCRSIRRWHHHHENAKRRAPQWRRQHADRWVKAGRSPSVEAALAEMDIGGVTDAALVELMLAAIGEPCPGMCAYEKDGGIHLHRIERVADMHIDVKDPDQPFTLENIGILCLSCNTGKKEPWATFMFKRRAALRAWRQALSIPRYRRSEQLTLPGFE